jgi:MFS family permease
MTLESDEEPGPLSARRRSVAARARSLAIDVRPLRESPPFRRLFLGQTVSLIGSQMTLVAVPLQVYALTRSNLAVGLLGLVTLFPMVVFAIFGGAIADAVDRRRMLLVTESALLVCSLGLFVQALLGNTHVSVLYVLQACIAACFALNSPARGAILPRLVRPDLLPAANALGQVLFNTGVVLGPMLAGLIVSKAGYEWAYGVDVVTFVAALAVVAMLPPLPPEGGGTRAGVSSVKEGLGFLRTRPVLLGTFVVDLNAMVFGMPRALFPGLAATTFGGGEDVAGLLYSAPAAGALVGALLSGWFGRVHRQGRAVLLAVVAWGGAIAVFGLTSWLPLALVMLAVAGAADMVSAVFRNAILQAATPDAMRGRLQGVHLAVVAGGPRLGDVEAGTMAALVTPRFSVVSGGIACMVGVAVQAALLPALGRYTLDDAENPDPAAS